MKQIILFIVHAICTYFLALIVHTIISEYLLRSNFSDKVIERFHYVSITLTLLAMLQYLFYIFIKIFIY